ncbi:MAG: 2OG-Fe(II) oxygenase [Pseudomonadota bacterium]
MASPQDVEALTARANSGDAQAQYALAAEMSRAGRRSDADRWLNSAAENGCADALYTIATRLLYSSENADAAAEKLRRAKAGGSSAASRLLGVLSAIGVGMPKDERRALDDLLALAKSGDAGAAREIACILALRDLEDPNINALLAISGGADPVAAAFALARAGAGRRVDGDAASFSSLLRRLGYPRAENVSLAPPALAPSEPSAPGWEKIAAALSLSLNFETPAERLAASPDVLIYRQALAPEICEYVIAHSASRLGPSLVYNPVEARMIRDPLRTSATASLSPIDLDLALIAINRLMAHAAGCAEENGEFLSVLHYAPGQQYRPHFDCIPPGPDFDRNGQREKTALLFLNEDYEGGETQFTEIELNVRGGRGDILVFSNLTPGGEIDRAARHAGLPVTKGAKWLASKWFRTKKFHF